MQTSFLNIAAFSLEFLIVIIVAGKTTTDDELEEMLESGNPSIFTSDVSAWGGFVMVDACVPTDVFSFNFLNNHKFINVSLWFLLFKDYIRFTDN